MNVYSIQESQATLFARVGIWSTPEAPLMVRTFGLYLPCEREDVVQVGKALLKESLRLFYIRFR